MIAGSANAASYSDADDDGACEVGEDITFEGDISYIDEDGNEHFFESWYWDFNDDGSWEENGRIKTHTFSETGTYIVKLYEINAAGKLITFEIEIVENNDNPGNDDDNDQDDNDDDQDDNDDDQDDNDDDQDDNDVCKHHYRIWIKVKRFLRKHPKYRHRMRWALNHLMKNHKCNCNK